MILAFDTSDRHCIAALMDGDTITVKSEKMAKGQAERLFPLIEELLAEQGVAWSAITRIGVGIGPGNFTGVRIAVSAARGLALGLNIPAVGVSGFDIIRAGPMDNLGDGERADLAVVAGQRGIFYAQDADGMIEEMPFADPPTCAFLPDDAETFGTWLALATAAAVPGPRPAPLYLRPADAAPSKEPPPVILDDA